MEVRFQIGPKETSQMDTQELRKNFLMESLMKANSVELVYTHYDRVIFGGAVPVDGKLELPNHSELKSEFFLERRELGIINVGGNGTVTVDGKAQAVNKLDCLYAGKGSKVVSFESADPANPAVFFLLSAPAHQTYPVQFLPKEQAMPTNLGAVETANQRTVYKYIHAEGIKSCQLVMGLTVLNTGSVWNTIPSHTHTRRMEAYFYFDIPENQRVFHFMGEPTQTRHMLIANHQAIVSPAWSIHSGCGTSNYSFIWGMAGENYNYADMDVVDIREMR